MNYYEIGQRVRKYRKAKSLSQDMLAERTGISVTHMSHIETGNTKMSLQVLVQLSAALEVSTDDILFGKEHITKTTLANDISLILDGCSIQYAQILKDAIIAIKVSIDKYL